MIKVVNILQFLLEEYSDNKIIEETIPKAGNARIYDDKYFFYSRLDKFHRPRQIFLHKLIMQ